MSLYKNEYISYQGGTARVKSTYANGFVVLTEYNKDNPPKAGDLIVGVDSQTTLTLGSDFTIDETFSFYNEFETAYPPTKTLAIYANETTPDAIGGPWVVLDSFFTGLPSQYCQTQNFITVE